MVLLTRVARSRGLGLDRANWERRHRPDGKNDTYDKGAYYALFRDGRVWHLEHSWGDRGAIKPHRAHALIRRWLPSDARLTGTYPHPVNGNTVEVFHSEALAGWFPAADGPGTCIAIYRDTSGLVTSVVLAVGNNA